MQLIPFCAEGPKSQAEEARSVLSAGRITRSLILATTLRFGSNLHLFRRESPNCGYFSRGGGCAGS